MVNIVRRAGLLVAIGVLFLSQESVIFACTCDPSQGIEAQIDESASVFEGTVTRVTPTKPAGIVEVRFRVLRAWKGAASPELVVRTGTLMCGLEFGVRDRWLVLAHGEPLFAGLCSPSGRRSESRRGPLDEATLKALGKPTWTRPEKPGKRGAAPPNNEHLTRTTYGQTERGPRRCSWCSADVADWARTSVVREAEW